MKQIYFSINLFQINLFTTNLFKINLFPIDLFAIDLFPIDLFKKIYFVKNLLPIDPFWIEPKDIFWNKPVFNRHIFCRLILNLFQIDLIHLHIKSLTAFYSSPNVTFSMSKRNWPPTVSVIDHFKTQAKTVPICPKMDYVTEARSLYAYSYLWLDLWLEQKSCTIV